MGEFFRSKGKFSCMEVNVKILFGLSGRRVLNTAKYLPESMNLLRKRKKDLTSGSFQKNLRKLLSLLYFTH